MAALLLPVAIVLADRPQSAYAYHPPQNEKQNSAEIVLYSDEEGSSTESVFEMNQGNWAAYQPSAPDTQQPHAGYAHSVSVLTGRPRDMRPPLGGNFWFPDYYDDHVAFAHFVGCDNNNTSFNGCQTDMQSIGVYDMSCPGCDLHGEYRWLEIPSALAPYAKGRGSVSDIAIDKLGVTGNKGRLYYIGSPNYIGYFDYDETSRTWIEPQGGTAPKAISAVAITGATGVACNPGRDGRTGEPCGVGNEMTILKSGHIAVTDRNEGWIRIFNPDLSPWSGGGSSGQYWSIRTPAYPKMLPLTIESSPVCAGPEGPGAPAPGKCRRSRFAINYDVGGGGWANTPITEYIFDVDTSGGAGGFFGTQGGYAGMVPSHAAWKRTNEPKPGDGIWRRLTPGAFRAIKYDNEGSLWTSTFDPSLPYNSSWVMAFYPQRDPAGNGNDLYAWSPGYDNSGPPACHSTFAPAPGAVYLVCEPHLDPPAAPHQGAVFNSTGRFVDSIVDAGSNIYWAGWGGSFDGVVRTNPGQWPPNWVRSPAWPVMAKSPDACGAAPPDDAFAPKECKWYEIDFGDPSAFPRGAISLPPSKYEAWRQPGETRGSDQLTHLVYDPDRRAVWTTVQGLVKDEDRRPGSEGDPAPFQMQNIDLPQWLLRFNVKPKGQYDYLNKPFIIDPTGSMSGEPGDQITVGAKIYSSEPLTAASIMRDDGSGPPAPIGGTKLDEVLPGVYQVTAKTSIPNKGATAKYRIEAANGSGAATPTDWFDLIPSSTSHEEWHFAEGYLADQWRVYVTVSNVEKNDDAKVEITFRPGKKVGEVTAPPPHVVTCTVAKKSRLTLGGTEALLAGNGIPAGKPCTGGNAGWDTGRDFAISVISKPNASGVVTPVIAERPIYFETTFSRFGATPINGASNAMGVNYPSAKWYFAEGTHRPGFDNYLTLSNVSPSTDATVTVKLLHSAGGGERKVDVIVPKNNRATVHVTGLLEAGQFTNGNLPPDTDYGIEVQADIATIVAERPIYYVASGVIPNNPATVIGGDVALGTPGARKRFIFSEGRVSPEFGTWVTISNPNAIQATAEVRYFTGGDRSIVKTVTVPAFGRTTDSANTTVSGAINVTGGRDAGVEVRADQPVVVERPIYFASTAGLSQVVSGAHHAVGTTLARTEWGFAEGYNPAENCSGNLTVTEYFTITNPGLTDAKVDVELFNEAGQTTKNKVTVRPGARRTVSAHDLASAEHWCGIGYGAKVSSKGAPIVVERPTYWNRSAATPFVVKGGHNVLPRHTFGLNSADANMLTSAYAFGQMYESAYIPPPAFNIESPAGEITATTGQPIGVEATTTGPVDRVEVRFNPFEGESSAFELTRTEGTDSWAGSFAATEPGVFQVIAYSGEFSRLGPARGLFIAPGGVSGRVTGESTGAVPVAVGGVTVNVLGQYAQVGSATTDANGYYYVGLPGPGDYRLSFLANNAPGTQPGYADRYSVHVSSWQDWLPIAVPEAGAHYDEVLPRAGRIEGTVTGANDPGLPVVLGDVSVTFYDTTTNKPEGRSVSTGPDGRYEIWLEPGSYHGLVNSATAAKPLGWNGYSPIWSRGQLFDGANGGALTAIEIPSPETVTDYDEVLPKVYPVSGRVVPQGGPGLGGGGAVGSYKAIAPNGQFWAVDLPTDGNYSYPLPDGIWKIVYVVPGYQLSYYHDVTEFSASTDVVVSGGPVSLDDQHIVPD